MELTLSGSSDTNISPSTAATKLRTPRLCANTGPTKKRGNRICYPGDIGTPTGSLERVKLVINSVLSRRDERFADFDIGNVYPATPMDRPDFFRIRLDDIPKEFIAEYNHIPYANNGWI